MKKLFLIIAMFLTFGGCQKDSIDGIMPIQQDEQVTPVTLPTGEILTRAVTVTSPQERAALVAFYNNLTSSGTLEWPVDDENSDPCVDSWKWDGVTCNSGKVVSLDLSDKSLTGPISDELGNLSNLQWLSLRFNQLTGPIPTELGSLTNLEFLLLDFNQLTGPIPSELGNLTNLRYLYLGSNELSGPIPTELANLTNLEYLQLYSNKLIGPIPAELGNLTNLGYLELNSNELTGPIPAELGNLSNLEELWLHSNELTGPIPTELGSLSNLRKLFLNSNELTGPIPAELGVLTNLTSLYLHNNQFECYEEGLNALCGRYGINTSNNPGLPLWSEFCSNGAGTCSAILKDPTELKDYFDDAVTNGEITVLNTDFSDKVNLAAEFFEAGQVKQACQKLDWLLKRCDGEFPPKDMIEEAEPGTMKTYIMDMMVSMDCGSY